jgi:pimeloyl-ACP methyl ester carboxylesterase
MRNFKRILANVDPSPYLTEIDRVENAWALSTGRQEKIQVQREAMAIPLRGLVKSAIAGRKRRDVHESRWTTGSRRFPKARAFLEWFAVEIDGDLGRAKIVCLPASRRVYPHIDRGAYYQARDRYHLVLWSAAGSWMKVEQEEVRMREGELWWFDNNKMHEAANEGDQDRIHMIFDVLPRSKGGRGRHVKLPGTPSNESSLAMFSILTGATASADPIYRPGTGDAGLPCWLTSPSSSTFDLAPIVAVHGIGRAARDQLAAYAAPAAAARQAVIAPKFGCHAWPAYQRVVHKGRADLALLDLMDELRAAGVWRGPRFMLAGYSGGAQFAHRFAMLYPQLVDRLILVSAGWYTFPDAAPFPYGLSDNGKSPRWGSRIKARLAEFLSLPITVAVGARDSVGDKRTRRGPMIDRQQGTNRLERAQRWTEAVQHAARAHGLAEPAIDFVALPESGHDFTECVSRGGLMDMVFPASDHAAPGA